MGTWRFISGIGIGALFSMSVLACKPLVDGDGITRDGPPLADTQLGCSVGCHGSDVSNAPPNGLEGETDASDMAVGAHRAHLNPAPTWYLAIECNTCHLVPSAIDSPGHIDDDDGLAELSFGFLAGPNAAYTEGACTDTCHGTEAWGGSAPAPQWNEVVGGVGCGSCHGLPPPEPHPQNSDCASCHPTMEPGSLTFLDPDSHINGSVELAVDGDQGCSACHGDETSSAPPVSLDGGTAIADRGVGTHRAHLQDSDWHRDVVCSDCHRVPTTVDAPGHLDGDDVAEVPFGALNPQGLYDISAKVCSNNYCHGNGRGSNGSEVFDDAGTLGCNACHRTDGNNMSGEHDKHIQDEDIACAVCHSSVIDAAETFLAPDQHINGVHEVDLQTGTYNAANQTCAGTGGGCHGNDTERW